MALQKDIKMENGVTLSYHRVTSVDNITNISSIIQLASYIDSVEREKEAHYVSVQNKNKELELKRANNELITDDELLTDDEKKLLFVDGINVLKETKFYKLPYDKNLNVDSAYEYLKTLDEFKDAKDV